MSPQVDIAEGRRIGPYRVVAPLGRGGMGVVYRVVHESTGDVAALKTVNTPSTTRLAGLRREIQALARVRHPGIVRIVGEGVEEGAPWYAMELLEGPTLREHAFTRAAGYDGDTLSMADDRAQGPAAATLGDLAATLRIVRRLCPALSFLHGEGIVHRDLTPENVLVRDGERPVLVDFGLTAHFAPREELHVDGELFGTVHYLSPEQARGEQVDARADLYSLGCILYELVVGRPPFVSDRTFQVVEMHLTVPPVPPSSLVPGVPPALDELLMRLLDKEPVHRLGHADDVERVLATLGAEEDPVAGAPRPRAYLYRPRLAGRERPLALVRARLDALRDGDGGVAMIAGETGVGKTRLVMELAATAAGPGIQVLTGACVPPLGGAGQARPLFHAIGSALQHVADRCREGGPQEAARLLGDRGPLLALFRSELADVPQDPTPSPLPELPPQAARARLFTALTETLGAVAGRGPLVLVLDDLQWADDLTMGWLASLLEEGSAGRERILVVGTYRTEEVGPAIGNLLSSASRRMHQLLLSRLDEAAVAQMIADMLALEPGADGSAAPRSLVRFLWQHSSGNPFFVAEYLRAAVARGLLARDGRGAWWLRGHGQLDAMGGTPPLPGALREIVERRLQSLDPEAQEVLEAASVSGPIASDELLARLCPRELTLAQGLSELVARQVLEPLGGGAHRFVHDQIRQVAYERLDSGRRRELHARTAEVLEALPGATTDGDRAAALGHHWEHAGQIDRALPCYREAATLAMQRNAHEDAERLLRAHLAIAPPGRARLEGRHALATLLITISSRPADAAWEYRHGIEEARALGDRIAEARCIEGVANTCWVTGRMEEARALQLEALAIGRETGDAGVTTSALSHLAVIHHQSGQPDEARALYRESIEAARASGRTHLLGTNLTHLANLDREQGHFAAALAGYEEALALHVAGKVRRGEATILVNLGELELELGHVENVRRHAARALALSRELRNLRAESYILEMLAEAARISGELDAAADLLDQTLELARSLKDRNLEATASRCLALVALENGRGELAIRLAERAWAMAGPIEARSSEAASARVLAMLLRIVRGDGTRAASLATAAAASGERLGLASDVALCACELGHAALSREGAAGKTAALQQLERARHAAESAAIDGDGDVGRAVRHLAGTIDAAARGEAIRRGEARELLAPAVASLVFTDPR